MGGGSWHPILLHLLSMGAGTASTAAAYLPGDWPRHDVPARKLRLDVPARKLRIDVPSADR